MQPPTGLLRKTEPCVGAPRFRAQIPRILRVGLLLAITASAGWADAPPCNPCAGIRVADPLTLVPQLESPPRLQEEARLYVAWDVPLDGTASTTPPATLDSAGAVPWCRLLFKSPSPLSTNLEELERELEVASTLTSAAGEGTHFQIIWQPDGVSAEALPIQDYAFLVKRAAVTITGARTGAPVISQPLPPAPDDIAKLYAEEIAAYLDGIALRPAGDEETRAVVDLLTELDPGKPLVLDALPYPERPEDALADAARGSVAGFAVTLFEHRGAVAPPIAPLKLLAQEFQGDLSFDPYSTPVGGDALEAWSFVRGQDLGLRVIVGHATVEEEVAVTFSDPQLRRPTRLDIDTGEAKDMYSGARSDQGLELRWQPTASVTVLRLERLTAAEIEGIAGLEDEVTVVSERQLPVEEILRRLQAFEDAQRRRLTTYRAVNTTHLRFQFGTEGIEATFEGEMFFRREEGYDWAWQKFLINGLHWKGKRLPEIPLIQPERAANLPLEILFTRDYRYRLRGAAVADGRDCWVVDFQPLELEPGKSLFRGTVWIDRELFARVRSRAVQVGLTGDVVSNEETLYYTPVDNLGQLAAWHPESFWLPLRVVSQQIWSIFSGTTVVEKETLLTNVFINEADFDSRREEVLVSDVTMVRDTAAGLRYLVPDQRTGERIVKEGFDSNRLFFAGGLFFEESLDYPLPLAGVDYFSLDFKGTGAQVNTFFAGPLLTVSVANPRLLGSRFDAGVDLFAVAIRSTDTRFRDNRESPEEEVKQRPASLTFNLGRQVGSFTKLNFTYNLLHSDFARSDTTADEFILPVDHFTHTLRLGTTYSRAGYRLRLNGRYSARSDWQPWGLPGSADFDADDEDNLRWDVTLAKTFHLRGFKKAGLELQYVDGVDLDRFSKYEFGFFSDVRVHGYESNRVRAEQAAAIHGSYGFELNELFRLQLLADAAWATDKPNNLDRELLGGVGLAGTVIGPWQTLVRLDLGLAVAGPDDGFNVFIAFLKLYK